MEDLSVRKVSTAEAERKCEDCYYSRPAVNDDLMFCSYIGDVMAMEDIKDGYNMELAKDLSRTIAFSGDVFEAFIDTGKDAPILAPCVAKTSSCRKYKKAD